MKYCTSRDVAKISNKWDYTNDKEVCGLHYREKVNQTCLSPGKVKPTDGYFSRLPAIIYIPDKCAK